MDQSLAMEPPDSLANHGTSSSLASTTSQAGGLLQQRTNISKPRRPCDACRKRKSRCEIQEGDTVCVLCKFHHQTCLFNENPQPRKRRKISESAAVVPESTVQSVTTPNAFPLDPSADVTGSVGTPGSGSGGDRRAQIRQDMPIDDYANLKGPSLLKKTLGLQNHRHSKILGKTSQFDHTLLSLSKPSNMSTPSGAGAEIPLGPSLSLRKVTPDETFLLVPDSGTVSHSEEQSDLDAIESLVAPHGAALIHLYFRIVHPTFPVLHKRVFLEKYERTHREFSPPLLAAVYLLAINWWPYSADLSLLPKPDVAALESIAQRTMSYIISRPKLSTIQAGLLLLQRPEAAARDSSWALTGQLVALGQDLGLHQDCAKWRIPQWERGLRKRLGWALFMQDKWGALMHGRPSHLHGDDWAVRPVSETDFPERAADEDEEEGSTEVEKGRMLFCEMIKLTGILARILNAFYTLRAEEEFRAKERENAGAQWVLERAKGMQIALKEWYTQLPECLRMESVKPRKLSSTGYLHLAYLATEITLHRHLLRSLSTEPSSQLFSVVRSAANARLTSATDFVKSLRPEHLQSFWYCASTYCFSLVAAYIGLLWATSRTRAEAESYREKLDEYRWLLRLSSRSAEILERAAGLVGQSTAVLVRGIPTYLENAEESVEPEEHEDNGNTNPQLSDEEESGSALGNATEEYEDSARQVSIDVEVDAAATTTTTTTTSPVTTVGGVSVSAFGVNGAEDTAWNSDDMVGLHLTSPTDYHQVQDPAGLDLFWPELALPGSGYEVPSTEYVHNANSDGSNGQWA